MANDQKKMDFEPIVPMPVGSYIARTQSGEFKPAPGFMMEGARLTELPNGLELVGVSFRRPAYSFLTSVTLEAPAASLTSSQLIIRQVEGSIQFLITYDRSPESIELNIEMIKRNSQVLGARVDDGSRVLREEIFPEIE